MIFIPGNVPSLKNSKQIAKAKNGKTVLLYSKTVKSYLRKLGIQRLSAKTGITAYKTRQNVFKSKINGFFDDVEYPCVLGMYFVRDSRRKFDVINAMQIICDLLVAHGFIIDDDTSHLLPVPMKLNGAWSSVDKDHPGVYLKIIKGDIPKLEINNKITEHQTEMF